MVKHGRNWWLVMALGVAPWWVQAQQHDAPRSDPRQVAMQVQPRYPGVIELEVDARDIERRIQRVRQRIPVSAGALTLWYPQWIPGNHAPTGPINQMAGLVIRGNGQSLQWTRDSGDMYAFTLQVPEGVSMLEVEFQYLSPTAADQGRVAMTPNLLDLQWHRVVLYPAGVDARGIQIKPSLRLPAGWQSGSALELVRRDGDTEHYATLPLMTLIDSPVFAGRHFRRFALDDSARQPVWLEVVAENPQALQADATVLEAHRALVREADAVFGSRPYSRYNFLLAVSDVFSGIGLEHAQSSENGMHDGYLRGERPFLDNDLLPHEYAHAWIGKAWRPRRLGCRTTTRRCTTTSCGCTKARPSTGRWSWPHAPGCGSRTTRWACWRSCRPTTPPSRAGNGATCTTPCIRHPRLQFKAAGLGRLAACVRVLQREHAAMAGRGCTPAQPLEGQGNAGRFRQAFPPGWQAGRDPPVRPQRRDAGAGSGATRQLGCVHRPTAASTRWPGAGGSGGRGWEVYFSDLPNPVIADGEAEGLTDLQYSLGMKVGSDGVLQSVGWESAAFKAGLAKDMTLLAVNGLAYSGARLKQAVTDAKGGAPVELIVRQADSFRTVRIDYRGGLRYPHLRRIGGRPDLLTKILAPRR